MPRSESNPDAKLARIAEYHRALAAFSRLTSESILPERLMQHACAQVSRVTHIKHTKILRYRADRGDLLVIAGVGWKPGVVGVATLGIDSASPPGRAMQTAGPVTIDDLPNDPEFRTSPLLRDHNIISLLNVPIATDARTWGVLEVDSERPHAFDSADVDFLVIVANMIGTALGRQEAEQKATRIGQDYSNAEGIWKNLVSELQHRTKNNFQTIIAFLTFQRRDATTEDGKQRFTSVVDRVYAIALAYDQLSATAGLSQVEFGDYLRSLCANIDPRNGEVSFEVQASAATMPLDRAVPAGLIVNELVTNALKYAFADGQAGLVRVIFTTNPDTGEACIEVEDNGKGMGPPRQGGVGLTLIAAFARQLSGRVERCPVDKGTRTRVWFPLAM